MDQLSAQVGVPGARRPRVRTLLATLVFVAMLLSPIAASAAVSQARAAVSDRVRVALDMIYNAAVAVPGTSAKLISDRQLDAKSRGVRSLLQTNFTGAALEQLTVAFRAAMSDQQKAGLRDVDGGATDIVISKVDLGQQSAEVWATATVWLRTESVDGDAARTMDTKGSWSYDFHLALTDDGWMVDYWETAPVDGVL